MLLQSEVWPGQDFVLDGGHVTDIVQANSLLRLPLHRLHLKCTGITDRGLEAAILLPIQLLELSVNSNAPMQLLPRVSMLSGLTLRDSILSSDMMISIGNIKSLRKLCLGFQETEDDNKEHEGNCFNPVDLIHLRAIPSLIELNLAGVNAVDDDCLVNCISILTSLQNLNISECARISDRGIAGLYSLCFLRELNLSSCILLTNASLYSISVNHSMLRNLDLWNNQNFTDTGFAHLSRLHALQQLESCGSELNDDGLRAICSLHLCHLHLFGYKLSDAGLAHLARLALTLQSLRLRCAHLCFLGYCSEHFKKRDMTGFGCCLHSAGIKCHSCCFYVRCDLLQMLLWLFGRSDAHHCQSSQASHPPFVFFEISLRHRFGIFTGITSARKSGFVELLGYYIHWHQTYIPTCNTTPFVQEYPMLAWQHSSTCHKNIQMIQLLYS